MPNIIKYIGLNDLNRDEASSIKQIIEKDYEKIHRLLKNNITDLSVHVKTYGDGKVKKYSIHIRAEAPTRKLFSTEAFDRDIKRTMRKALTNIINEIKHNFDSKQTRLSKLKVKQVLRKK